MSNSGQFDLIIIGAGVMGSSTAYQASKRGLKTLLLEQFDFLHHRGSSHGESRTIRSTYPESYYPPMVIESENLWRSAESEIGYKVFFKSEQLDLGPKNTTSLLSVIANCEKLSISHQILDSNCAKNHFSGKINIPDDWIAVVTDLGGVLKPTKAVAMFQTLAIKHGAVLKDRTEVVDILKDENTGGVLVSSNLGQKFCGKKCVITAGAWVSKLVKTVSNRFNSCGIVLPIQPVETTVFYWRIKEGKEVEFTIGAGFPSFASYGEPYIYGTPVLEFPDLIKIAVHGGRECDPDKRTWGGSGGEGREMVVGLLKEWIRLTFGERVEWKDGPVMSQSCMYSMTPDEDYIIDFVGGEFGEDVVVACGFSGHGFKMAPVVGRMLVDMAVGGKSGAVRWDEELRYFKLERFDGNPRGNIKSFGDQVRLK